MPTDTREVLLEVATELLDAGGVEAVTLREVGKQAGVSHNAPYKHFASKEALLAAIAARELDRHVHTESVVRHRSANAALRSGLHGYIGWALWHPNIFRLVFGAWSVESPELAAAAQAAQESLVALVVAGQDAGTLPSGDPVRLASLVRSLAHGAADLCAAGHLSRTGKGHADPQDLVDDLLKYLKAAAH